MLPVGRGPPGKPVTVTSTLRAWPLPIVAAAGITVTCGVATVTETSAVPVEDVYADELPASGVYVTVSVFAPTGSFPATREIAAVPPLRGAADDA